MNQDATERNDEVMSEGAPAEETLRKVKPGPSAIDKHISLRVRQRRTLSGMTQETVAKALGLTFQQIQKYESGANRISAGRLYQLASLFHVPISYFFNELPVALAVSPPNPAALLFEEQGGDPLLQRETIELVRAYYSVEDHNLRKRFLEMLKALNEEKPSRRVR